HSLTIERLTENPTPCEVRLSVFGLSEQVACRAPCSWCVHPVPGSHASVVQEFPSSQLTGAPPLHCPSLQTSPVVQAFPSLHDALLFTWTQPAAAAHESSVHGFPSSHETVWPTHWPSPLHLSPVVQSFPSLHSAPGVGVDRKS